MHNLLYGFCHGSRTIKLFICLLRRFRGVWFVQSSSLQMSSVCLYTDDMDMCIFFVVI